MEKGEESRIFNLSSQFRKAIEIESCKRKLAEVELSGCFSRFPNGCCGDTSELLGQFLLLNGIHTKLVTNAIRQGQSHAWLLVENGSLIVDITGDQFTNRSDFFNFNEPVYVGGKNKFYQLFNSKRYTVKEVTQLSNMGYSKNHINWIENLLKIILEYC